MAWFKDIINNKKLANSAVTLSNSTPYDNFSETRHSAHIGNMQHQYLAFKSSIKTSFPNLHTLLEQMEFDDLKTTNQNSTNFYLNFNAITPSSLEMLEAELQNQSILPKSSERILHVAYRACHEINYLRWRARGSGLNATGIRFVIDLARYIIHCSMTHCSISDFSNNTIDTINHEPSIPLRLSKYDTRYDIQTMEYFESFAGYLTGKYTRDTNKYNKGLNTLLTMMTHRQKDTDFNKQADTATHTITLPISKADYMEAIKSA